MSKTIQSVIVGLLLVVGGLQLTIITRINSMMPVPTPSTNEVPRVPSLDDIDSKIRQWTMHYGQHFSSTSAVSRLESTMETRLSEIDRKLDALSAE